MIEKRETIEETMKRKKGSCNPQDRSGEKKGICLDISARRKGKSTSHSGKKGPLSLIFFGKRGKKSGGLGHTRVPLRREKRRKKGTFGFRE